MFNIELSPGNKSLFFSRPLSPLPRWSFPARPFPRRPFPRRPLPRPKQICFLGDHRDSKCDSTHSLFLGLVRKKRPPLATCWLNTWSLDHLRGSYNMLQLRNCALLCCLIRYFKKDPSPSQRLKVLVLCVHDIL